MTHIHEIVDSDIHFVIDPISRSITTESPKLYLTQYDHNSERYTFRTPRFIENHDLSECDAILIDYTNTNKKKTSTKRGSYKVRTPDVKAEKDYVLFSWLVSKEATQLAGYLTFSVAFRCYDDNGDIDYEWGTDDFSRVTILEKTRHDQEIVSKSPDLIQQIKNDILDVTVLSVNGTTPDEAGNVVITIPEGFSGSWNDLKDAPNFIKSINGNTPDKNGDIVIDAPPQAPDDEIVELLIQEDMLPVVKDSDGSFLADENENILLW